MAGSVVIDLARAEFEARIAKARSMIEDLEPRYATDPLTWAGTIARYWSVAARWNLIAGHGTEGLAAWRAAVQLSIESLEGLARNPSPYSDQWVKASDWRDVFEGALMIGDPSLASRLLSLDVNIDDGTLTLLGRGHAGALRALATQADDAARAAGEAMLQVSDEQAIKHKSLPGLGRALGAILDADQETLSATLNAICDQHVIFATRGYLRGLEAAVPCSHACSLIAIAQRRGMRVDVDARFHSVGMVFPVVALREWKGQPVSGTRVKAVVDIVPDALTGGGGT